MSSHFQSPPASTDVLPASTCFASPPSSDEADQITFPFGMHDKEYTLISSGTSYSDMNMLDYDKSNSGYATPATSSSDGECTNGKPMLTNSDSGMSSMPSDSATSVQASIAGPSAMETNGNHESQEKPTQNGLKRTASQAFAPPNGTQDVPDVTNLSSHQSDALPASTSSTMTSVKPAADEFDTLNATIERVALREGNLARIRKEAEEAAAAQLPHSHPPEAKRQRGAATPPMAIGNAVRENYTDPIQAEVQVQVPAVNEPQPSTSSAPTVAYGPLDPIDTATVAGSEASTPLATPASKADANEKGKPKKKEKKEKVPSVFCHFVDKEKNQSCKQRAIKDFKFCIRHILNDPTAPYKRCEHRKKPKGKPDAPDIPCTNAIGKDKDDIYCTTHLIMMGIKQPKKKKNKNGDDTVSTLSVDGSDPYIDSVMTNGSNQFVDEFSMSSYPDNSSRPATANINGFDQPPSRTSTAEHWAPTPSSHHGNNGYHAMEQPPLDMGYDPSQPGPSNAYYGNMEPMMPMQQQQMHPQQQQQQNIVYHPPPPTSIQQEFSQYEGPMMSMQQSQMLPPPIHAPQVTFSLIQNANGDQILVDENGVEQPAGSYSIFKNPDGSLQASFHNMDHRQGEMTPDSGFPSATPPESAPPMFAEDQRRQLYHSQSVDGSKTYDPLSFPPSQAPSVAPTPQPQSAPVQFGDVSRQHPQLSARLMQPSAPMNNQQQFSSQVNNDPFIMDAAPSMGPDHGNLQFQQSYNTRPPTADNVIYIDPACTDMPPPPMPQQSQVQSRSSSTRSNAQTTQVMETQFCALVTFENGDIHMLPGETRIINNPDGSTSIVTPPDVVFPPGKPISVVHAHVQTVKTTTGEPIPEPQPEIVVEQVVEAPPPQPAPVPIDPMNVPISTKAPYPFLPHERPPKYAKVHIEENAEEDEAQRMLRDYTLREPEAPRRNKMIILRQKRQRMRIGGSFRKIPVVDEMCRTLEDYDFDGTDLFPLGLEPSDDDEWSDEEDRVFTPQSNLYGVRRRRNPHLDLFLSKKSLRRDRSRLKKNAAVAGALMSAGMQFPNSTGAALRTRHHYRRGGTLPETKPFRERRCYHMQSVSQSLMEHRSLRCPKPCLPRANHCSDHIQHNIDQFLYQDCKAQDCERPLLPCEATLTGGLCRQHYDQEVAKREAAEAEAAAIAEAEQAAKDERQEYMMHVAQMESMPMMSGEHGLDAYLLPSDMNGYHDPMPMSQEMMQQPYMQQHSMMDHDMQDMQYNDNQMLYGSPQMNPMTVMSSETTTTNSNMRPYPSASNHVFDEANTVFYGDASGFDSSAEGIISGEDLSIADAVKDLGIPSDALNAVMAETLCDLEALDEFPLGKDPPPHHNHHLAHNPSSHPNPNLDNSWEDIHSFLVSEGHPCSRLRKKMQMRDASLAAENLHNNPNNHSFVDGLHRRESGTFIESLRRDGNSSSLISTSPTIPTSNTITTAANGNNFIASPPSNGNYANRVSAAAAADGFDAIMYHDLS